MTETDQWRGLSDFVASMNFWRQVQETLAPSLGDRAFELLMYETPYLDGHRVIIPNGPANARDGEGYRSYSILQDREGFSIRSSGVSRANEFSDSLESWFGSLELAGKYFLYDGVCNHIYGRLNQDGAFRLSDVIDAEGLRSGWTSREVEGPTGYPRELYFDAADPGEFYVTFTGDTRTSQIITKTFREINQLYAAELGLEWLDIAIPDTTT